MRDPQPKGAIATLRALPAHRKMGFLDRLVALSADAACIRMGRPTLELAAPRTTGDRIVEGIGVWRCHTIIPTTPSAMSGLVDRRSVPNLTKRSSHSLVRGRSIDQGCGGRISRSTSNVCRISLVGTRQ